MITNYTTRTTQERAVLAEWLRRMLKAHVRKSVGSIPTDCTFEHNCSFAPTQGSLSRSPSLAFDRLALHLATLADQVEQAMMNGHA